MYEDKLLRELRIERLKSPRAFSQQPPSRCHHLLQMPSVEAMDAAANHFPMPLEASGDLDVHVGRIRADLSNPNGLVLWVAGDPLLKGAAWNAVQIAEELAKLASKPGAVAAE